MSNRKCNECEEDVKTHVILCLECMDQLTNKKYNDFAFVLATINNKIAEFVLDAQTMKKKIEELEGELAKKIVVTEGLSDITE